MSWLATNGTNQLWNTPLTFGEERSHFSIPRWILAMNELFEISTKNGKWKLNFKISWASENPSNLLTHVHQNQHGKKHILWICCRISILEQTLLIQHAPAPTELNLSMKLKEHKLFISAFLFPPSFSLSLLSIKKWHPNPDLPEICCDSSGRLCHSRKTWHFDTKRLLVRHVNLSETSMSGSGIVNNSLSLSAVWSVGLIHV